MTILTTEYKISLTLLERYLNKDLIDKFKGSDIDLALEVINKIYTRINFNRDLCFTSYKTLRNCLLSEN